MAATTEEEDEEAEGDWKELRDEEPNLIEEPWEWSEEWSDMSEMEEFESEWVNWCKLANKSLVDREAIDDEEDDEEDDNEPETSMGREEVEVLALGDKRGFSVVVRDLLRWTGGSSL